MTERSRDVGSPDRARKAHDRPRHGESVPTALARAWEPTLGSLADVRIHTGPESAAAARALDTQAFTVGRDVHFADGAYRTDTGAGREMLGHELVHAAQPVAPGARVVAPADHPAEREAARGPRAFSPRAARAGVHRFLPPAGSDSGLRHGEALPVPLVMAVMGDRFTIGLQIDAQRQLAFVITADPQLDVTGPGPDKGVLRLPLLDLDGTFVGRLVEQLPHQLAYDIYGDGHEIFRIGDNPDVGTVGRSRLHDFIVLRNDERATYKGAVVGAQLEVFLPMPERLAGRAGNGTPDRAVSTAYHQFADLFRLLARRFGDELVAVTIVVPDVMAKPGDHPTIFVPLSVAAEKLTCTVLRHAGRSLDIDLNGDGKLDLRIDHAARDSDPFVASDPKQSFIERTHVINAFDGQGQRVSQAVDHQIVTHFLDEHVPAIPAADRAPFGADEQPLGAQVSSTAPPAGPDRLGARARTIQQPGNVLELRVDADGDRRKELLIRVRPPVVDLEPDHPWFTVEVMQISTRSVIPLPMQLDALQAANVFPLVTRLTDGVTPLVVDLVRYQLHPDHATAPPRPVTLTIKPPVGPSLGSVTYEALIEGAGPMPRPTPLNFAAEPPSESPLVRSVEQQPELAGMWIAEAVLGEFGDRFRFTVTHNEGGELLGISALNAGGPGETRAVQLVAGAATQQMTPNLLPPAALAPPPMVASMAPQQVVIMLGNLEVDINDALGVDPGEPGAAPDPHVARTHRLAVTGSAVAGRRVVRFDYYEGKFHSEDRTELEIPAADPTGTPWANATIHDMHSSAVALATVLKSAINIGVVDAEEFAALQETQRTLPALCALLSLAAAADQIDAARSAALSALTSWIGTPSARDDKFTTQLGDAYSLLMHDDAAGFETYEGALDGYKQRLSDVVQANAAQKDVSASAAAVDILRPLAQQGDVTQIKLRFDAAIAQEIVHAHKLGLISDALFDAWNSLHLAKPALMLQESAEAKTPACEPAPAMQTAIVAARAVQTELAAATTAKQQDRESFTGEAATFGGNGQAANAGAVCAPIVYTGGDGEALAGALAAHAWAEVWPGMQRLDAAIDRWVTKLLELRIDEATNPEDKKQARQDLMNNKYVHSMREKLDELPAGAFPVAATYVPDTAYANELGYAQAIPVRLFVWHDGTNWQCRDLSNPENIFETPSVSGRAEDGPPDSLFQGLNYYKRFPRGVVIYQVPNSTRSGRVLCTEDKPWYVYAREAGLALAAAAFVVATLGSGIVVLEVAGATLFAASGVVNAAAAAGQLIDDAQHGQATVTSVAVNIFDIITSLASAGSIAAGTTVRSAVAAERAGQVWTGARAEVAALADRMYIPLAKTALGANVAMAAVISVDTFKQLNAIDDDKTIPDDKRAEAKRDLLLQLALVSGLTAMAVHGELPELRSGKRTIVLDVVRFPDGSELAVARAAGVRLLGKDLELAASASMRDQSGARWRAAEAEGGKVPGLEGDEREAYFKRWLEMPDRITVGEDGKFVVHVPDAPAGGQAPPEIKKWLTGLALGDSPAARAERALAIADRLTGASVGAAGLKIDPLDPEWAKLRPTVVRRLGGDAQAEAIVTRFEQARLGELAGKAPFQAQRAQLKRFASDADLEHLSELFGGYEVYATGGALEAGTDLRKIENIRVIVAVPKDVSPDVMAAIEQRAKLARVHPDPELLQAHDLPAEHTLGVEVQVVPTDAIAGFLAEGSALHRVDNVITTRQIQLTNDLDDHLRAMGVDPDSIPKFEVRVLPDDQFSKHFESVRGRSVIQLEGDRSVVFARPGATRLDMLDEASHLAQAADPALEHDLRLLSGQNFEGWNRASASDRLEMFQAKLNLEIDAKQRTLSALNATGTATEAELAEVEGQLDQLQKIQQEVASFTPEELAQMNAGVKPMPDYLESPPWLFSKRVEADAHIQRHALPANVTRTHVTDSSASKTARVERLGNSWNERTIITSGFDGKVSKIDIQKERTIITVERPTGTEQAYAVSANADLRVKIDDPVEPGATLAVEPDRTYRLVEITDAKGVQSMREEIRMPDGSWQQRGKESTFRGTILEQAAMKQADEEIAKRVATNELAKAIHLDINRGGGGFDDVIVEFVGTGKATTARIRIREVKDYPNRSVPLAEFTAITDPGLGANLDIMRRQITAADDMGAARLGVFHDLDDDQMAALVAAVEEGSGQITVEVVAGPTTKIGEEGHHASKVVDKLRTQVEVKLGPGSFRPPDREASQKLQPYVDDATKNATPKTP